MEVLIARIIEMLPWLVFAAVGVIFIKAGED